MKACVIDIGSNSTKFLIAKKNSRNEIEILEEKFIEMKLGKGINKSNYLLDEKLIKILGTEIENFIKLKESRYGKMPTQIVATSAVRDAKNKSLLCKTIDSKNKCSLKVLTGNQEAYYIGKAIQKFEKNLPSCLIDIFDLGGGSLEFIRLKNNKIKQTSSFQLGCIRITEKFNIIYENINEKECDKIKDYVKKKFENTKIKINCDNKIFIMGGSISIIMGLLGNDKKILYDELFSKFISIVLNKSINDNEISKIPKTRFNILPAAFIVLLSIMEFYDVKEVSTSTYNLKFGIMRELLMC